MSRIILLSWVGVVFTLTNFLNQHNQKNNKMNKVKIIYVYDAICGWCFGFSPSMTKLKTHYKDNIDFEVISGGLKLGAGAGPIDVVAPYIKSSYQDVERTCGVKFGDAFVKGTLKKGTIILNSLPPAVALCIMKEKYPDNSLEFARLLHKMYYVDGIEPENYEAYGTYAAELGYDKTEFNKKMKDSVYIHKAYKDFDRAKQLGASSFPTVLIEKDGKIEFLFSGYTTFDRAKKLIDSKL